MPKLELFYLPTCPYCHRVFDYLQQQNIEVELLSITEPANRSRLVEIGGSAQVPCLFIDGKPLYESLDIIEWFKANAA
jgi:glutaredoxin